MIGRYNSSPAWIVVTVGVATAAARAPRGSPTADREIEIEETSLLRELLAAVADAGACADLAVAEHILRGELRRRPWSQLDDALIRAWAASGLLTGERAARLLSRRPEALHDRSALLGVTWRRPLDEEALRRLVAAGWSSREIAGDLAVSLVAVRRARRHLGLAAPTTWSIRDRRRRERRQRGPLPLPMRPTDE